MSRSAIWLERCRALSYNLGKYFHCSGDQLNHGLSDCSCKCVPTPSRRLTDQSGRVEPSCLMRSATANMMDVYEYRKFSVLAILGVILWHTDLLLRLRQFGGGRLPVDRHNRLGLVDESALFFYRGWILLREISGDTWTPHGSLHRYSSSLFGILVAWVCVYAVIPSNWPVAVRDHGWWQPFQSETLKNVTLLGTQHIRLFLEGRSCRFGICGFFQHLCSVLPLWP